MFKRYAFFKEHAGYVVGRRAECALSLARAEVLLEQACELGLAEVEWVYDDMPYDGGDVYTADEVAAKFESNEWTGPYGCVVTVDGETVASLWGIVVGPRGTGDPYCRVVAAELADEALQDLRQAIGDKLDREQDISFA